MEGVKGRVYLALKKIKKYRLCYYKTYEVS